MPSFGQKLKLEREKRSITLEQISLTTKIGTRMLQALEEENFDQLPGGIFNKGFVRAYARHVGLDEDEAIKDYLEASGTGPAKADPEMEPEIALPEPRDPPPTRQIPWGLFAGALLLVALALFLWSRWQGKKGGHSGESAAPAATQKSVTPPATAAIAGPTTSLGQSAAPNPVPTSTPPGAVTQLDPSSGEKNIVSLAAEIAPAPPVPGQFTVVILAREDSWLSITADGKNIFEDTLVAENQRAVHGQREVVIKAGNTGALDFVFNGKKLNPQGDYGDVKTLTFGPNGLQPNAPAPPVTQ